MNNLGGGMAWNECKPDHTVCQHKLTLISSSRVYTEYKDLEALHTLSCVQRGHGMPMLKTTLATSNPVCWGLPLVYPSDDRCLPWRISMLKTPRPCRRTQDRRAHGLRPSAAMCRSVHVWSAERLSWASRPWTRRRFRSWRSRVCKGWTLHDKWCLAGKDRARRWQTFTCAGSHLAPVCWGIGGSPIASISP